MNYGIKKKENVVVMEQLFHEIIHQAKKLGFKGFALIYKGNEECLCELYNSESDYYNGKESEYIFGYCKPLIKCLEEKYLNHFC